jgi:hypothetical protein
LASHHIIPRHLGGTDDIDNLVKLTYADHAKAHSLLYETFGLVGDKKAWKRWEVAAQDEQAFLDGCVKGGQIGGKIGWKVRNDRHGNPGTFESRSKGGSIGGKTRAKNVVERGEWASVRAKGIAVAAATWISLYDGTICARSWISRKNKQDTNRIGTWVEL